jgi:hypothetical protein
VAWTSDVSDGGQRLVDPFGTGPGYPGTDTRQGNGVATAALTCGIIGMLIAWVPFVVVAGIVLGILALVFGIKGLRRSASLGSGRGAAITGIVTGGLTLLLAVVGIVLSVILVQAVADFIEPGPVDAEVTDCSLDGRTAIVDGSIVNESRSVRDYTLFVTVDERVDIITFDALEPGVPVEWTARIRTRRIIDECQPTLVVQGPFPFGIEIDPIER